MYKNFSLKVKIIILVAGMLVGLLIALAVILHYAKIFLTMPTKPSLIAQKSKHSKK